MSQSHMEVRDLRKEFGSLTAVNDVSFEVAKGEFVSILGPSGSGKSTILRMIGGFEHPTAGSIRIDGEEITHRPPFRRDVNMVFQNLALFPHLTVGDNIKFGLKQSDKSLTKSKLNKRVDEALEMVQLSGYNDRDPSELSGGEQQRVAVARAVVNEPELLLLDEPLSSLDRKLRQQMQTELQQIQQETGITFLYVTHDQEVALSVSDKLILLNEGHIEQQGTVEQLYENPESPFVADFIGDSNEILVKVKQTTDTMVTFEAKKRAVTIPTSKIQGDGDISVGSTLLMCIRPESIHIDSEQPSSNERFAIDGSVRNRIYSGESYDYRVNTPIGEISLANTSEKLSNGAEVTISWSLEDVHMYTTEAETNAKEVIEAHGDD